MPDKVRPYKGKEGRHEVTLRAALCLRRLTADLTCRSQEYQPRKSKAACALIGTSCNSQPAAIFDMYSHREAWY